MRFDASGGLKSIGRSQLLRILRESTQAEVAEAVGCSQQSISFYACGQRVPQLYRERIAIERVLGIDADSWDITT